LIESVDEDDMTCDSTVGKYVGVFLLLLEEQATGGSSSEDDDDSFAALALPVFLL
jgi:hypothetical protein